jgi:hypothetical protein
MRKGQNGKGKAANRRVSLRQTAAKDEARLAGWVARALCGLCLLLAALGVFFAYLDSRSGTRVFDYWAECAAAAGGFSPVGAVIVAHRPRHSVGWIFLAIGFVGALRVLGAGYASYALLAAPGTLPGGEAAAWIVSWVWVPHHGLVLFLFLLFPDGRPPGPRWRWPARLAAAAFGAGTLALAFSSGPVDGLGPAVENPLGVGAMANVYGPAKATSFALGFLAVASLFGRLHYARGVERQQLKWCAYATAVLVFGATLAYTVAETLSVSFLRLPGFALVLVGVVGLPVAVAIAILRHNLFDIDLIVDLTIAYGLSTAMLAGVVEGALAVLEHLFLFRIGQESEAAIFVSALAVAVLFSPLRRRIEGFLGRMVRGPEDA